MEADNEYLYDKPYSDNSKVRVAGPFTVEGLSPHRTLGVNENDELIDTQRKNEVRDFAQIILRTFAQPASSRLIKKTRSPSHR